MYVCVSGYVYVWAKQTPKVEEESEGLEERER